MNAKSTIDNISNYLSQANVETKLDRFNLCAHVYKLICASESPADSFAFFLSNVDSAESDKSLKIDPIFTQAQIDELKEQYGDITDSIFEKILKENQTEEIFYHKLWKSLTKNYLFESDESVIFAIYYISIDVRTPYFQTEKGRTMPNAIFKKYTQSMRKDIEKARFIIRSGIYTQWTSQASVLLTLIDSKQTEDERIVLMAQILKIMASKSRITNASSQVSKQELLELLKTRLSSK